MARMSKASSDQKGRNEEGRKGSADTVWVRICDWSTTAVFVTRGMDLTSEVGQHREPEKRVGKAKDAASDNGEPCSSVAVAGECEPDQADWEQPDGDERGEESGLGAAFLMTRAIAFV
jgi:hypothetical protein